MPGMPQVGKKLGAPALLVLMVTIGMAIAFWPIIEHPSEKKFYGYGDSWLYYGPTQFYGDYVLHHGELPLWNPLLLCGQPIAGNPQYAIFYPPNLARRLLTFTPTPFETHVGLAIMLYLHVISAALGAYACGRVFGLSRMGAFTAGVAFVFSAAFTQRIFGHLLVVMVVSWLPWCLLCLRAVLRAPTFKAATPAAVALGAAYAMAILAGTPQMTLLVGFTLLLFWLIERAFDAAAEYREKRGWVGIRQRLGQDVFRGGLAVLLAAGLAAPLGAPALQFFADTPRGTQDSDQIEKITGDETFSLPELMVAYGGGPAYEGVRLLGAAGLVFVVVGLFSARRRDVVFCAVLAILLIDASLEHSVVMLRVLLFLSPFPISSPARGLMMAALPLALLIGFGVDVLRDAVLDRRKRVIMTAATGLVAILCCILIGRRLEDFMPAMSPVVLLYPILAAACVAGAFLLPARRWLPAIALCILLAEALHWRGAYIRMLAGVDDVFYSAPSDATEGPPVFWNTVSREAWNKPNRAMYWLRGQINGFDAMPLTGVISTLTPGDEANPFWRAAPPNWMAESGNRGYLLLKRSFWLHNRYVEGDLPPPNTDFPVTTTVFLKDPGTLSVPRTRSTEVSRLPYSQDIARSATTSKTYVFTPDNHPTRQKPILWQSGSSLPPLNKTLELDIRSDCVAELTLYANDDLDADELRHLSIFSVQPSGGRIVRYRIPLPDTEALVIALMIEFVDPSGTVNIERSELIVDHADENDRIRVIERSANRVEVEVRDLPGPRILSCIDFNYPGWHAYVDGKEVDILQAFTYFKAVEVPAGTHRIRFEFRPRIVYVGMALGLLAVVACAALFRWASPARAAQEPS